jgi:hypothetical protein
MKINPQKLIKEFEATGIPVVSVHADGRYFLADTATPEQLEAAAKIVAAHTPEDYLEERQTAYLENGLTPEAMLEALWQQVVEHQPDASNALQSVREHINAKFPKDEAK